MKHFLICDTRMDFLRDVSMRVELEEQDWKLQTVHSLEEWEKTDLNQADYIFVCETMLEILPGGIEKQIPANKLMGYSISFEGIQKFKQRSISCIGLVAGSGQLLTMIAGLPAGKIDADTAPKTEADTLPTVVRESDFNRWKREKLHSSPLGMRQEHIQPDEQKKTKETVSIVQPLLERRSQRLSSPSKDHEQAQPSAAIIAIGSSKGGVGKTTVATQLATCLALTSKGRRRFRTCVVDYNIGFGDVATMLDYDPQGITMSEWVDDIREKLQSDMDKDSLQYSREEIETYLQKRSDTGLYALLAPARHNDSVDITAAELEIMLRNLSEFGEFDFIVVDTGNDTSDATLMAMERAKEVLLVATQDVTCAHCLELFLQSLQSIGFNMEKIRLIINNVMSAKDTGIAVAELKESFPYPCWAIIRHDTGVIRSNNFGKPIVFSANHDMTKQLRAIVSRLNSSEAQELSQNSGFFRRLFQKRG